MAGRQWGAIRTLPSGRVQASYTGPDDVRYAAPSTFSDDPKQTGLKPRTAREKAEAWLRGVRADIERGAWLSPAVIAERAELEAKNAAAEKFGTYAATWIAQRKSGKGEPLRPKTRAEYERQLAGGLAEFANDRVNTITAARVRAWHDARTKHGMTQAGAEARLLRAILNTALVDGIIDANPVPANLTRTMTGKQHRPPTLDELGVILAMVEPRFRLAILLAAYGNIRLSEWRALTRQDVTVTDGRALIDVHRQAQFIPKVGWNVGEPKSSEGVRIVPLPTALTPDVEAHLRDYVDRFPASLLFAPVGHSEFMHDRQFNKSWNVASDAAGIRESVREHDLRGFALTTFAQAGGTLRETQKFGGHGTVEASLRYQHAAVDRIAEIVDRMPLPPSNPKMPTPIKRNDDPAMSDLA